MRHLRWPPVTMPLHLVLSADDAAASSDLQATEGKGANGAPRNIKQVLEPGPQYIELEVLSSKNKVSVTVDGTMVSYLNTRS